MGFDGDAVINQKRIDDFRGDYRWLSNFHRVDVELDGVRYPSTEHAYQAAKTLDSLQRESIRVLPTCGMAKRAGQRLVLRADWEPIKRDVMLELLRQKYRLPELRTLLLQTGDAVLVEGNTWGDTYWGMCNGVGENWLGRLTMQVRDEIAQGLGK